MRSIFELQRIWDSGRHWEFTPHERDRMWLAQETGFSFDLSKARICATLRNVPWVEADWRRGVLSYHVSGQMLADHGRAAPNVPFGWAAERDPDRNAWEVGPAWYILPRRWYRALRWRFYRFAIQVGAVAGPEGCYFSELKWWPSCPRYSDDVPRAT